ncbi:hypothetical protein GF420_11630 [candidate division GN15 bacterium]|nr:hypothetical protein [candidate division GN15 bacterium]
MLRSINNLGEMILYAEDGEFGTINDLLFDDQRWLVRYAVIDTGNWLPGGEVLVSPMLMGPIQAEQESVPVALRRDEVERHLSGSITEAMGRQRARERWEKPGSEPHWVAGASRGAAPQPVAVDQPLRLDANRSEKPEEAYEQGRGTDSEPFLRSGTSCRGFRVQTPDGSVGRCIDLIVDDDNWVVRYLVVQVEAGPEDKTVLLARSWIDRVSWADDEVHIQLSRDLIARGPGFDPGQPLSRQYEEALHEHFRREGYW